MSNDPYKTGMFKVDPYWKKSPLQGQLVVVLDGQYDNRGLELIPQPSRALQKHEIHELILTDELEAVSGKLVNRIAYLGFMEILEGGVMVIGDEVRVGGKLVGTVAGFDATHMPNHLNIVIKAADRSTGRECAFDLYDRVTITKPSI